MKLSTLVPMLSPKPSDMDESPNYAYLMEPSSWSSLSSPKLLGQIKCGTTFPVKVQVGSFGEGKHTTFCATIFKLSEDAQAVVRIDSSNTILDCNTQVSMVFGYSKEEMLGKSLTTFLSDEQQAPTSDNPKKRKREFDWHSTYKENVLRMISRDGSLIYVNSTSFCSKAQSHNES